jgi:hypothetical protein
VHIDNININKKPEYIKNSIAIVESVKISRYGYFDHPIKSFFIFSSLNNFEIDE